MNFKNEEKVLQLIPSRALMHFVLNFNCFYIATDSVPTPSGKTTACVITTACGNDNIQDQNKDIKM